MNQRTPTQPKADIPLPKAAQMPPPPPQARPNRVVTDTYAEDAMKSAQRVIDMATEIDRLGQELEDWRRRCLMAEGEVKRLESRENILNSELERRTMQLTEERDSFRSRLTLLVAQFHSAGNIILKCLEAAQGQVPMVNLANLADELERDPEKVADESKLMRAITGPPRSEGEKIG